MIRIKETVSSAAESPHYKDLVIHEKLFADGLIFATLEDISSLLKTISGYNEVFSEAVLEKPVKENKT